MSVAKGFAQTWYELCNADGGTLVLDQIENRFLTEELAAQAAGDECRNRLSKVTVKECTTTIKRIFQPNVTATEM